MHEWFGSNVCEIITYILFWWLFRCGLKRRNLARRLAFNSKIQWVNSEFEFLLVHRYCLIVHFWLIKLVLLLSSKGWRLSASIPSSPSYGNVWRSLQKNFMDGCDCPKQVFASCYNYSLYSKNLIVWNTFSSFSILEATKNPNFHNIC